MLSQAALRFAGYFYWPGILRARKGIVTNQNRSVGEFPVVNAFLFHPTVQRSGGNSGCFGQHINRQHAPLASGGGAKFCRRGLTGRTQAQLASFDRNFYPTAQTHAPSDCDHSCP